MSELREYALSCWISAQPDQVLLQVLAYSASLIFRQAAILFQDQAVSIRIRQQQVEVARIVEIPDGFFDVVPGIQ